MRRKARKPAPAAVRFTVEIATDVDGSYHVGVMDEGAARPAVVVKDVDLGRGVGGAVAIAYRIATSSDHDGLAGFMADFSQYHAERCAHFATPDPDAPGDGA